MIRNSPNSLSNLEYYLGSKNIEATEAGTNGQRQGDGYSY